MLSLRTRLQRSLDMRFRVGDRDVIFVKPRGTREENSKYSSFPFHINTQFIFSIRCGHSPFCENRPGIAAVAQRSIYKKIFRVVLGMPLYDPVSFTSF